MDADIRAPRDRSAGGLLLKGGVVVDGSGASRFESDVRVWDGLIVEVGADLVQRPDERLFDATGCLVTPGFIDHHTHYDGTIFWASDLDPSAGYGVTTVIMGNCGFGLAPLAAPEAHRDAIDIISFVEDLPIELLEQLPFDWTTWSGYRDAIERRTALPANYGCFVGHIPLRFTVMGEDARKRAATPAEIDAMAALLDEGLAAGAMGFSTNLFDMDRERRPVAPLLAADDELRALFEVLSRHPGATGQVSLDAFIRLDADEALDRIERVTRGLPVRIQWVPFPVMCFQREAGLQDRVMQVHQRIRADGRDIRPGIVHYPLSFTLSLSPEKELSFVVASQADWLEAAKAPTAEEKVRLLKDPDWRARARRSWDGCTHPQSVFANPAGTLLDNSENGAGPVNITLGDYAAELGLHPSDALAEWIVRNGVNSSVMAPPLGVDEDLTIELLRDPLTVPAVSDGGAHLQTICTGGVNMGLITEYARDHRRLTIEEAVWVQTGKIADFFGLVDRGRIAPGMRADIAVFNLDEVECREKKKVWDVPSRHRENGWRWTRDPAPMRLTLVNGVPTFEQGAQTAARPGVLVSPGRAIVPMGAATA
jgi:N-acyl-D-aspartate/D-glutamate deacylase